MRFISSARSAIQTNQFSSIDEHPKGGARERGSPLWG